MSIRAYQQAAARAENPRQTEHRLLAQVTRALLAARAKGRAELGALADALDWNRRVWSTFATDCAASDNGLPDSLRAGIISLSIFVSRHSSAVLREGADIDPLIDINRTVMQGLSQSADLAPAAG